MAVLGLDAKTYNVGSIGSPTFGTPIGIIREETINLEKSLADITDRRANGWRLQVGTLKEGPVDLQMIYEPGNTDFDAFEAAFFQGTQLVRAFMDGDVSVAGSHYGLMSAFVVTSFSLPRQLEEAILVDATVTPVLEDTSNLPPRWHTQTTAASP